MILVIGIGLITAITLIKYKPAYSVSISGEEVGYTESIDYLEEKIDNDVLGYTAKNVDTVTVEEMPTYELRLVDRSEKTNEDEIIVALQKNMEITYKYYEIASEDKVVDAVDTLEDAETVVEELKEENSSKELNLSIIEKNTENAEEIKTNSVEVAKENIESAIEDKTIKAINKYEVNTREGTVNGIKLAVMPVSGTISSRYGVSSRIRVSTHTGLDIACPTGTPIKVTADGTVTFAEYNGSYGNLIKVDHGNGVETWYAHCSKLIATVGQTVKAGDTIALVGSTGNSTGSHLHLEVRINGTHVDPQNYIY